MKCRPVEYSARLRAVLVVVGGVLSSAALPGCSRAPRDTVSSAVAESKVTPLPAPMPASAPGNPAWIDSLVARLEREPVQNPPGSIVRYVYRGEQVYSVPSPCCDQFGYVYTASRVEICAPSGGITGRGDGRCPDFYSTATERTVIWRETRKWKGR